MALEVSQSRLTWLLLTRYAFRFFFRWQSPKFATTTSQLPARYASILTELDYESTIAICASVPFGHVTADIILLSTDDVEIRVITLFLSLTSPFFESLFSLPQGPNGGISDQEIKDGLAVIPMSKDDKL
ncbi:hypothetical protein F4604DRAFT_1992847 [Suillus subluteus]|nr:hypothetical protein F4604DRAFT_1992847 [Suillus subluteus]